MADHTELVDDRGRMLFATHGHLWNPENLPYLAFGSAFLYGHTHKKQLERENAAGILLVNPGSVSIPKDGSRSFALFEDGVFSLKALSGEPIAEAAL